MSLPCELCELFTNVTKDITKKFCNSCGRWACVQFHYLEEHSNCISCALTYGDITNPEYYEYGDIWDDHLVGIEAQQDDEYYENED